ncbi:MAG: MarR family transcriptional regulator, partial [Chloroflexales bacterium]|nr:MarR family transcriptional regulator [Chloroflexales bacterium]
MPIELPVDEQATPVLTAEVSHFIENMGLYYENQGVPRIGGRILGLLLMTVQQLSAEHIAATLAVSRSSVSTNIRLLLASGLVEKVAFPGDRRDYYRFAPSAWERAIMLRMENV